MQPSAFATPVWNRPDRPPVATTPVADGEVVDLLVVGGGIQGLSTAMEAAKRGLGVRVIEAGELGTGASGLNGGQVIPGLKQNPEWLLEHFGDRLGGRLVAFSETTADHVFNLIEREKLAADPVRTGWVMACHTHAAVDGAADRHRQWKARGADVALLNGAETALLTGVKGYLGSWLDRRAGTVNPLALTLELARIATEAGVRISTGDAVTSISREGTGWRVTTEDGRAVRAPKVLVATNAYSGRLVPGLAQSLVPLHSFQIATAPLTPAQHEQILPHGQAVSDSRRIVTYFRKSPDGRFVIGGRGRMGLPRSAGDWGHLEHAALRMFPFLTDVPIERRWFGRVAMTADHLPHLHEPEKGLLMLAGCQGRGVALMTAAGVQLSDYIVSGDPEVLPFPVSPIQPIPFHAFRQVGVAALIAWYRMLDRMER